MAIQTKLKKMIILNFLTIACAHAEEPIVTNNCEVNQMALEFLEVELRGGYIPSYTSKCISEEFKNSLKSKYLPDFSSEDPFREAIYEVSEGVQPKIISIENKDDEVKVVFRIKAISPEGMEKIVNDTFTFTLSYPNEVKHYGCGFISDKPTNVYLRRSCTDWPQIDKIYKENNVSLRAPASKNKKVKLLKKPIQKKKKK